MDSAKVQAPASVIGNSWESLLKLSSVGSASRFPLQVIYSASQYLDLLSAA